MLTFGVGEVIAALGGQVILLGSAGWLIKVFLSHRLTKEAEEFKSDLQSRSEQFKITLQSDANVEVERLRASLQQVATEHQIRFAKLHEKRAMVVAEMYTRLVEAQRHAANFIFQNVRDRELAANTNMKMLEVYWFINSNRIYLPEKVCRLLDAFESVLRKSVINVDAYWTKTNEYASMTSEHLVQQGKVMFEACEVLESKAPAMLKELEREFRILLGDKP